jgi:hypothetical protein
MSDIGGDVERVRDSVRLTRAERTAGLRFVPSRIHVEPSLDERLADRLPALGRGLRKLQSARRNIASLLHLSELSGPLGCIDFVADRSFYSEDEDEWVLTAPGREFMGEPGDWELTVSTDDAVRLYEPSWLLELIATAVEATYEATESVVGETCRRYAVFGSFAAATRLLESPRTHGNGDLDRLLIDVWLDDAGRIRRAIFHGDHALTTLELSDFGVPDPIELPGRGEIAPAPDA